MAKSSKAGTFRRLCKLPTVPPTGSLPEKQRFRSIFLFYKTPNPTTLRSKKKEGYKYCTQRESSTVTGHLYFVPLFEGRSHSGIASPLCTRRKWSRIWSIRSRDLLQLGHWMRRSWSLCASWTCHRSPELDPNSLPQPRVTHG